jgi:hypothetical protein
MLNDLVFDRRRTRYRVRFRIQETSPLKAPSLLNRNALSSCPEKGSGQTIRADCRFVRVMTTKIHGSS